MLAPACRRESANSSRSFSKNWLIARRLRDPKIDDLRHGLAVVKSDDHVRRLEIAMDNPFLMRMLNRLAGRDE
jgi:hypothetical protein